MSEVIKPELNWKVSYYCEVCRVAGKAALNDLICWSCDGPVKRQEMPEMLNKGKGMRLEDLYE